MLSVCSPLLSAPSLATRIEAAASARCGPLYRLCSSRLPFRTSAIKTSRIGFHHVGGVQREMAGYRHYASTSEAYCRRERSIRPPEHRFGKEIRHRSCRTWASAGGILQESAASAPAEESTSTVSGGDGNSAPTSEAGVKKRVVSGIQPTGTIHLGNYLGAIKNWVALQDLHDTLFFVVDLHAITLPHDPVELRESTRKSVALYLASGIHPDKASIFVQSHVRAHSELTWLLSAITPLGWLNRMIQFKDKSRKQGEAEVGTGLLTYPVLMAADILLYQCDLVPVGEDQRQHLELSRDIAARVNNLFGGKKWKKRGGRGGRIFKVPEALIPTVGARVMSLVDGTSKMSKSAPSDLSRINLLDPPDVVLNKIKRCKTDSFPTLEFGNPERPECNNLIAIYQLVSAKTKEEVEEEIKGMSWGTFKPVLADALVEHLTPIQRRYEEVVAEPGYLDQVLEKGAERASAIANKTLEDVYDAMGFVAPKIRY